MSEEKRTSMDELYASTLKDIREGEIVKGEIVKPPHIIEIRVAITAYAKRVATHGSLVVGSWRPCLR